MTARARVPLLERKLLFVVGKGGVGRSTVAAALGLLAARRGARTLVAEVSGRGEMAELFATTPQQGEVQVAPGLWAIQIDTGQALSEYLDEHLPLRVLADLVGATRLIGYLAAATPGLREMLSAGKLWELAQPQRRVADAAAYDVVVVDAPASGHAFALLSAPQTFAAMAQGGPISRQGGRIDAFFHDAEATAIVGVARAEDAAVSELIDLQRRLREDLALPLDLVAINTVVQSEFEQSDIAKLRTALSAGALADAARGAVESALLEDRESRYEREQIARLAGSLPKAPLVELARADAAELGLAEVEALSRQLELVL
jgi:anion-transporting  ArsA/GET3 family ATPase